MSASPTTVSQLIYKTLQQFVGDMTTAYGSSLEILPNLQPGDPELAVFEATGTQDVFLESLLQIIWTAARASTASESDLDSFCADFNFYRLAATTAQGTVTLSALSAPVVQVPIATGVLVQTPGGAIQYQLIADTTQPAWSPALNSYVLPAGQLSINATAQATVAGSADNVQPGQLTQFATGVAGIATVTNGAAITNGLDQESDIAFRARFIQYLASLSKATLGAILFAVNSVQQSLSTLPLENTAVNFTPMLGTNTIIVDDGSGNPPATLLNNIQAAVNGVRAFGIQVNVKGPSTINCVISLSAVTSSKPTETSATIQSNIQNAVLNYINGIELEDNLQTVYINDIVTVATASDPNVMTVTLGSVTINGAAADLSIGVGVLPRTTLAAISVTLTAGLAAGSGISIGTGSGGTLTTG